MYEPGIGTQFAISAAYVVAIAASYVAPSRNASPEDLATSARATEPLAARKTRTSTSPSLWLIRMYSEYVGCTSLTTCAGTLGFAQLPDASGGGVAGMAVAVDWATTIASASELINFPFLDSD